MVIETGKWQAAIPDCLQKTSIETQREMARQKELGGSSSRREGQQESPSFPRLLPSLACAEMEWHTTHRVHGHWPGSLHFQAKIWRHIRSKWAAQSPHELQESQSSSQPCDTSVPPHQGHSA